MRIPTPLRAPGAHLAAVAAALLIAQQVAGKATRDALFLTSFAPRTLPWAMAAGAALSLLAVYWLSRLVTRHSPARVMPWLFFASAAGLVGAWVLGLRWVPASAVLVYLHTALFGPTSVSTFWSLVNERFDPHTAKRAVARVSGGATLGGVLGGLAAWRASTVLPTAALLLVLAALNAGAGITVLLLRAKGQPARNEPDAAPVERGALDSLRALRDAPFLRNLGVLVALGACTSALLDYVFSVQAAARFGNGAALLSFFSVFWLAVGVLSFLLQLTLGRVALEKLGLAVNIAILPGLIVLGGALGLAVPGLASASVLRGAESVQRNTLFRSAYEVLYTPLPEERKRATKALIDVGFDRVGTVLGSGLVLLALALFGAKPEAMLLGAVVLLALATLPVARLLHVGYVDALQRGLKAAAEKLQLSSLDPEDHGPVSGSLARDQVVARVEAIQPGGLRAIVEGNSDANDLPTRKLQANAVQIAKACTDLLSGDSRSARRALGALDGHGAPAACAISLLGHDTLHVLALDALRGIAPSITGQLVDALLDESTDFIVRRRIPRVLRYSQNQRAADGLVLGIADARFEVRYECGRALMRLTDGNPHLVVSREKVIEAIRREIEVEQRVLARHAVEFDEELPADGPQLVDMLVRDRVDRSLEHVFTILSLQLEREPLRTAFAALHHDDEKYRGTALEYLDTVLPAELRDIVWPYLGEAAPLPTARSPQEILAGLARVASQP